MADQSAVHTAYIVTGTTRGIGKALAEEIARRGQLLFSISSAPDTQNRKGRNYQCDLRRIDQIRQVADSLSTAVPFATLRRVVLINNAGVLKPISPLERCAPEQINALMQVNVVAPASLMGAFIRMTNGFPGIRRIINISSGAAHHPYAGWSLYCASKAALEMITACTAKEQKERSESVQICAVAPGIVETDMQQEIRQSRASDFPLRDKFVQMQKSGGLVPPATVAQMLIDLDLGEQFAAGGIYDLRDAAPKDGKLVIAARSVVK